MREQTMGHPPISGEEPAHASPASWIESASEIRNHALGPREDDPGGVLYRLTDAVLVPASQPGRK